jgi:hypothetical protein
MLVGVCLLALVAAALWVVVRGRKSAREQIVESILALEKAIEAKDVTGCMRLISPDYRDSRGHTRVILRRAAVEGFREALTMDVIAYEPDITISGEQATATLEAEVRAVTRTGRGEWKGEVTFTFQRERRRWRVVQAEGWQDLREQPW